MLPARYQVTANSSICSFQMATDASYESQISLDLRLEAPLSIPCFTLLPNVLSGTSYRLFLKQSRKLTKVLVSNPDRGLHQCLEPQQKR